MTVLYLTIWIALALFVAGEWGRAIDPHGSGRRWPWHLFMSGLALAIVHTLLSFALVHGWSHEHAVRSTAAQTASVFGVPFGGGVFVNYLFFAVWGIDGYRWRRGRPRARWSTWTLRVFYSVIIVNAAIVFAAPSRRAAGAVLVSILLAAWTYDVRRARA